MRGLLTAVMIGLAALTASPAAAQITVTDLRGRQVSLPEPARRIVLSEGRHMTVLGMLHDDPVALVAGWRLDKSLDQATMDAYRARFPAIDAIASVGSGNRDISVEAVIALDPDLVMFSLMDAGDPGMERALTSLEAVGIPVVYVDFFAQPLENSLPSLRLIGDLTGARDRAEDFAAFYTERLDRIRDRLADAAPARPSVFLHAHAAPSGCCATVGEGVFNDFLTEAGARNIALDAAQGVMANVSLEYLISAAPDFYVATGGTHMAARGGLVLGSGVTEPQAQASFAALLRGRGIGSLGAVEAGRAAGIWHLFNDSPSHIALIEYLAQMFHPDLFADLDPSGTMAAIERDFSPVEVPGTWWVRP